MSALLIRISLLVLLLSRTAKSACDTPPFCDDFPACSRNCLGSVDNNAAFAHSFGSDINAICGKNKDQGDNWLSIRNGAFACVETASSCTNEEAQTAWDQYVNICQANGYSMDDTPAGYATYVATVSATSSPTASTTDTAIATPSASPTTTASSTAGGIGSTQTSIPTSIPSSSSGGLSTKTKIGLGVGIGIGVPIVLGLSTTLFWLFRARCKRAQEVAAREQSHEMARRPSSSSPQPSVTF